MTRTYAAKRLLEHGPLSFASFWAITGWLKEDAHAVLNQLVEEKQVSVVCENFRFNPQYQLISHE